ncbi:MAG TPA: FmdB family zinc ribbon protein [Actinomycetota bacterium]|jgi:putative FmdB family regulatory protein|nr:FmdB family zinc ribbon protein [Actinomycetota bacterium]
MPTYTYVCNKCGTEYEVFQSMSDPPLKRCKKCRGALRRTFHPVGIVLKGPGFHKTDYRSSKSGGRTESSDKADKKEKAETKSEAKTDSSSGSSDKKASSDG